MWLVISQASELHTCCVWSVVFTVFPDKSCKGPSTKSPVQPNARCAQVLYLGAASGTSVSHVSDIVGKEGAVYAVEFSHRSGARRLHALCILGRGGLHVFDWRSVRRAFYLCVAARKAEGPAGQGLLRAECGYGWEHNCAAMV